jgi:hypothetical protein
MSGVLHGVVASLKAAAAAATDAFFEYVTLLLNTSATNGAQNNTFLDSSTNNFSITRNGDTTQGSFNPYMPTGYWSGYFAGGSSQNSLTTTQTSIGTGNFTFAMWVYVVATPADSIFFDTGTNGFVLSSNSSRQLEFVERIGTTAIIAASASTAISLNTWVHIAVVRSGTGTNQVALYINGTSVATGTSNHNFTSTTISIGARFAAFGGNWLAANAYISNVLYADSALTITLPTAPYTNAAGVKLLCLQDNRFIDNSTNAFAITRNGDTRISKFAPFNPPASYSTASYGGSGYFDGTGDTLSLASNAAFNLASSNFTLEAWIYQTSGTLGSIINRRPAASSTGWLFAAGEFSATIGGTWRQSVITATVPNNVWLHVALVRNSNTFTLYHNGTSVGTYTQTGAVEDLTQAVVVGAAGGTTEILFTGYIANARMVVGTAVYTANFTPPTTPLTAITNTSLLLNFTNAGIFDAATINDGQTVGNAQVSTTQAKWSPTSMAFDGTGDYLTVIDKPELRFGTGNFTVEFWVYFPSTSPAATFVEKGTGAEWGISVNPGGGGSGTFPLLFRWASTGSNLTGQITANAWTHVAIVREGTGTNQTKFYIGGTNTDTLTVSTNFNQTGTLFVGARSGGSEPLNGYIQDLRITNGYARYTANFTAPTAAFPTL